MIQLKITQSKVEAEFKQQTQFLKDLDFHQWAFVQTACDADYWSRLESFYNQQDLGRYKTMAIVGIGGSSLGAKALYDVVKSQGETGKSLLFFDDPDPLSFTETFSQIKEVKDVLFVLVSKSGRTEETLLMANLIHQRCSELGVDLKQNTLILTSNLDSELGKWAQTEAVPSFDIPVGVGGRFSVLTAVGILPALFLGQKIKDLQAGVAWALEQKPMIEEMLWQNLMSFKAHKWVQLYWMYTRRWSSFGFWLQQLWCESLGKKEQENGSSAARVSSSFVCQGPADQHSLLQQVSEAHNDKQVWFFRDQELEQSGDPLKKSLFEHQACLEGKTLGDLISVEARATREALKEAQVDSQELLFMESNMKGICGAFLLMELYVAVFGELLNINTFDQPGVENTKRHISKLLGRG